MASIKMTKKGGVSVKLSSNLAFALHLLCTVSLFEEGEHPHVRALLKSLPSREDIIGDASWGYGIQPRGCTIHVTPELLPTLRQMMIRVMSGGWPNACAPAARIKEIDDMPPLVLLATAAK